MKIVSRCPSPYGPYDPLPAGRALWGYADVRWRIAKGERTPHSAAPRRRATGVHGRALLQDPRTRLRALGSVRRGTAASALAQVRDRGS
ncbi:hypothetical protein GCM10017771_50020 [Streptomyces capitiformicae]|uniref:Uncharacterized protein n=1 Tax=Streptomyces capitiformicae TaxID=2014920 RepID=A0A918Z1K9_9ACTN|nr:hypothetical protein GCM10017771_50020 [Streptomyces capitiformicae]